MRNRTTRTNGYSGYDMDDGSEGGQSSNEWLGGDDEEDNDFEGDDEGELSGDDSVVDGQPPSLVVQLRYGKTNDSPTGEEQPVKEPAPGDENDKIEQQPQGAAANGTPNRAPEAPAESDFKMQVDIPPAAEQQPRSLESGSAKEPNGIANGASEGSNFGITPEARIAQSAAVSASNETG